MLKRLFKKLKADVKAGNERGARESLLEDLFYDFHRSRAQIYRMNFVRGVFFGFGSVLGGTLVVTLVIGLLSLISDIVPPLKDFKNSVVHSIEQKPDAR